jgi:predicted outer membrane repeat protein
LWIDLNPNAHLMKNSFTVVVFVCTLISSRSLGTIVTTSLDEDNGSLAGGAGISLREAVKYSASGAVITFAPALSGQTIRLTGGHLLIQNTLTIDASSLPGGIILSGDKAGNGKSVDDTRILSINGGNASFNSLTFAGGSDVEVAGGIYVLAGTATIDNCTFSGNSGRHGGAIWSYGSSVLTIRKTTFSGNSAQYDGGGICISHGTADIQNCTFSGNTAATGGGIRNLGTLTLQNSIVAGNSATTDLNISGSFTGSYNLTSGTPRLAPLGNYGGPTRTMPPVPGSPAIGAANWPPAFTSDQRGFPIHNKPDIGAAEFQNSDDVRFWKLDFDGDGFPYGVEQALGTDNFVPDPGNSRNLTAPTFDSSGHVTLRFGKTGSAAGTRWVLKRSPDLNSANFVEIYRYSLSSETMAPGISCERPGSTFIITDANPPPGQAFYRFEAVLQP